MNFILLEKLLEGVNQLPQKATVQHVCIYIVSYFQSNVIIIAKRTIKSLPNNKDPVFSIFC